MLLHIPSVLTRDEVKRCQELAALLRWTSGGQNSPDAGISGINFLHASDSSEATESLNKIVMSSMGRNPAYNSAALPRRVTPALFTRYDKGMSSDMPITKAICSVNEMGVRIRRDMICTLFLTEPAEYEGGELVLDGAGGVAQEVKLPAGDMILHSASMTQTVNEVTRGTRIAAVVTTESMVRDESKRTIMLDLDTAIMSLRAERSDSDPVVLTLTNTYHNLMRTWCSL